ncbi:hypothetical protein SKAU_G00258800 [Synaphobranchus kaupii]|uniref:Uncharacterized protein n=1 Tax=Synaphobranchus kaupii TaxID=118154 RepID=A0A9Q1ISL8_SYNKA|nr:hypothetical protein SKAU_G00258800 [Synaphobranchus kaupii]
MLLGAAVAVVAVALILPSGIVKAFMYMKDFAQWIDLFGWENSSPLGILCAEAPRGASPGVRKKKNQRRASLNARHTAFSSVEFCAETVGVNGKDSSRLEEEEEEEE